MSHVDFKSRMRNLPLVPPTFGFPILALYHINMVYPIKTCVVCGEEFELKPGKPGFANRCPDCSEGEATDTKKSSDPLNSDRGANAARREAMRNLLYRKDS
jgi:DNA-directed RNA polymerase subunit RPC12/RpoP